MAARASRKKRGREEAAALEAPDEPVFVRPPPRSLECPICTEVSYLAAPRLLSQLSVCSYQVFSDASMLPKCGHTFCQQCIVSAMGEKRECPMCRAAQPPRKRYSASLLLPLVQQGVGQVEGHSSTQSGAAGRRRRSRSALQVWNAPQSSSRRMGARPVAVL